MNGINAVKAILILLFATVCVANGEDDKRYASNKAAGLFPFPRVGRAGGRLLWSLEAPTDHHSALKRQGLFSFPRVGRNERQRLLSPTAFMFSAPSRATAVGTPMIAREMGIGDLVTKRDEGEVAGMWFGPRLGRRGKRQADHFPWTFVALKENPALRRPEGFMPNIARDSNEDPEYPNIEEDEDFGPISDFALQARNINKSLNKSDQAI